MFRRAHRRARWERDGHGASSYLQLLALTENLVPEIDRKGGVGKRERGGPEWRSWYLRQVDPLFVIEVRRVR